MLFRSVPQIEVTFDIDANGIVNVSAKDLGTGIEQKITITASSNMSKDDIEKAVKEAEQFAETDKVKREEVDLRNSADQMVFQVEKALEDMGDKVQGEEKDKLVAKKDELKQAITEGNIDNIKTKLEEVEKLMQEFSAKAYAQATPDQAAQEPTEEPADTQGKKDDYVDAEFREVDDQ